MNRAIDFASAILRPYLRRIATLAAISPYSTAARVRAMIGGLARHGAQVPLSVASSGMPQMMHPEWPRKFRLLQQGGQKLWSDWTIAPHPGQRGGSAKSSATFAPRRTQRLAPAHAARQ